MHLEHACSDAHPSGRPIRRRIVVGLPIQRIPEQGPLTPRLQVPERSTTVIGFVVETRRDNDEGDE